MSGLETQHQGKDFGPRILNAIPRAESPHHHDRSSTLLTSLTNHHFELHPYGRGISQTHNQSVDEPPKPENPSCSVN